MYWLIFSLIVIDTVIRYILYFWAPQQVVINSNVAFGQIPAVYAGIGLLILFYLMKQHPPDKRLAVLLFMSIGSLWFDRVVVDGVIDYLPLGSVRYNLTDVAFLTLIGSYGYTIYKKDTQ